MKHFWVENKELNIAKQHNQDFFIGTSFSIKMLVYKFTNHLPHQKHQKRSFLRLRALLPSPEHRHH